MMGANLAAGRTRSASLRHLAAAAALSLTFALTACGGEETVVIPTGPGGPGSSSAADPEDPTGANPSGAPTPDPTADATGPTPTPGGGDGPTGDSPSGGSGPTGDSPSGGDGPTEGPPSGGGGPTEGPPSGGNAPTQGSPSGGGTGASPTPPPLADGSRYWSDLEVGECLDSGEFTEPGSDSFYLTVDCAQPHDAEVYARVALSSWASESAVQEEADRLCGEEFAPFVGVDWRESELAYYYLYPLRADWRDFGTREALCVVVSESPVSVSMAGYAR